MQTERQREARNFARRASARQEIRARADRDVTVLLAEAQSKGEQTRGEGDSSATAYSRKPGRDPEFFGFYRSMQAYEAGLRSNETRHATNLIEFLPVLQRSIRQAARVGSRRRCRGAGSAGFPRAQQ